MATKEMVKKLRNDYEKGYRSTAINSKGFRQSHYVDWLESVAVEHFENKSFPRMIKRKTKRWDLNQYSGIINDNEKSN